MRWQPGETTIILSNYYCLGKLWRICCIFLQSFFICSLNFSLSAKSRGGRIKSNNLKETVWP